MWTIGRRRHGLRLAVFVLTCTAPLLEPSLLRVVVSDLQQQVLEPAEVPAVWRRRHCDINKGMTRGIGVRVCVDCCSRVPRILRAPKVSEGVPKDDDQ